MRRRLNLKFAACLLAGAVLLGGGVHFLHGFQVKRSAAALLRMAKRAEDQGRLKQKLIYLRLYLVHAPHDPDALADYGLTLERLDNSPKVLNTAFEKLELAVGQDPGRKDLRRHLVDLAMRLKRFRDAVEHLNVLQKSSPNDAELEHLRGVCLEGTGAFTRKKGSPEGPASASAEESYARAIKYAPTQVKSYVSLAQLLRGKLNDPAAADKQMQRLLAANPSSWEAWLASANYLRSLGAAEADGAAREKLLGRAARDVQKALELVAGEKQDRPLREAEVLLESAEIARARGKLDEARDSLQRGLKLQPHHSLMYKLLAYTELQAKEPKAAVKVLRKGIEALGKASDRASVEQADLRWALAKLLTDQGDLPEAGKLLDLLRKTQIQAPLLNYLAAWMDVKRERWAQAAAALEKVQPLLALWRDEQKNAHFLLAACYEQLADPAQQYAAYRAAARLDDSSQAAQLGMASALLGMGKTDEAIEAYRKIPSAKLTVARLLIGRTLRLPEKQRVWGEVEQILNGLAESAERSLVEAELLLAKKQLPQAEGLLLKARDKNPQNVEVWVGLAELVRQQGKPASALAYLEEARKRLGDKLELRLALVEYWARHGGPEAAKALAKLTREAEGAPANDRRRLLRALAGAQVRVGNPAEAEYLYSGLAAKHASDLGVRLALFDLALQAGKEKLAERAVNEMRSIEGEAGAFWRYAKAVQLIKKAKGTDKARLAEALAPARALLEAAAKSRPAWPRPPLAEGEILERSGDAEAALAKYQQAIELGEQDPRVMQHVVQLLYAQRRYQQADQLLQKLRQQSVSLGGLDRVAADLAVVKQDYEGALALARKAKLAESKDHKDHIWLGQVLWAAKQQAEAAKQQAEAAKLQAEAAKALRRAVELAGDAPETWVALVQFLARTGEKAKAEAATLEAERRLPKALKDRALLPLAHCNEAVGNIKRAEKLYAEALDRAEDDPVVLRANAVFALLHRPADAEALLRKMIKGKTPEAAWARQMLAFLIGVGGNYQQAREALAILGIGDGLGKDPSAGASVEDQRARAAVLGGPKRTPREWRQAITILEGLAKRQALADDDQYRLASLYDAVGEWKKADEQILSLLAKDGQNPNYVAQYAASLLRRKGLENAQSARTWADRLEKLEPKALRTLQIKAFLLKELGKAKEAVPFLKAAAGQDQKLVLPVAGLLEALEEFRDAEEMYGKHVEQSKEPTAVLALAQFLGRRHRAKEALDRCEPAWKTCPPEAVAQVCILVISEARQDKEAQAARVERWLQAALDNNPKTPTLRVALGVLQSLLERYEDAEASYRKVLEADPRNATALNNLAWLLAFKPGKGAEALALVERAIERVGRKASLLDTRALVHLALKQNAAAVKDLDEAIAQQPSALLHFHRARALLRGNRKAAAQAWALANQLGLSEAAIPAPERLAFEELRREFPRK
jgi:tetratricopeptide (TPR) repeat protein